MCRILYKKIAEWGRLLWNLFLPRSCAVCGRELLINEHYLCLECYAGLPLTYFWRIKDNPAEIVFWGRTSVERVYSLYYYVNNYRKPIHALKYKSYVSIGIYLGKMLGEHIANDTILNNTLHFIIPVPLHFRKKWKRGYNQSQIIAKGIQQGITTAKQTAIMPPLLSNLLKRKHFTNTQTQKDRVHRWHNVANAFDINYKTLKQIHKLYPDSFFNILLVDDVLTTGATLEACCNILHKHLKCKISIATLAYVE